MADDRNRLTVSIVATVECPHCQEAPSMDAFQGVVSGNQQLLKCPRCGRVERVTTWLRIQPEAVIRVT